jgi:hypothetical protein
MAADAPREVWVTTHKASGALLDVYDRAMNPAQNHNITRYIRADLAAPQVPREPTPDMIVAAMKRDNNLTFDACRFIWRNMYDAAPAQPDSSERDKK